ncbi:MAG: DUF3592 domain-containing protein [Clostridia bacterium]|nr:DUF3592 domain-containing protein [Clostridia bacterium]
MAIIIIKLLGIFFTYIGGASLLYEIFKRIKCKEYTSGKVVDIFEDVKTKKGKTKVFLYPIFEYIVDGNTYTEKFNVGTGKRNFKYAIGEEVEIYYIPTEPQKYYVKGNIEGIKGYALILIVGLVFLFVV